MVTNACGSATSQVATLTVVADTTPPVIHCPTNDLVVIGSSGTNVFFNVTATDCDTNVSVVCSPPSGALFPCGTNVVTCTATDSSGNHSTCAFRIIVQCACLNLSNEFACTNGPALPTYSFTFQNNSTVPVKYLFLFPATNCFSFAPDILTFNPPVLPGQTTNVSVTINLAAPCTSNLCFTVSAHDTNLVQCCALPHCVNFSCPAGLPKLTIVSSGGLITLSWTGTGILQSAPAVTGPWTDSPNQSNPQTFPATGAQFYFRLRQ